MTLVLIPAVNRAAHAITAFIDAETRLKITQSDAHILAHLAANGASTVGEIHSAFGHKRSTLTSILNRLADRELVTCTVHEADKRSFLIGLTSSGEVLAQDIYRQLLELEQKILSSFPPRDQKNALQLLTAVTTVTNEAR